VWQEAAGQTLTNSKGVELRGPLLIDVDAAGKVAPRLFATSELECNCQIVNVSGWAGALGVDERGTQIVAKQRCPPTTSANVAKMKVYPRAFLRSCAACMRAVIEVHSGGQADGYFFHSTGEHRNNWVRGMAPPQEPALGGRVFDPRGDFSRGNYGVSRGVPGMDEEGAGASGAAGGKKKKKKPAGARAAEEADSDDDGPHGGASEDTRPGPTAGAGAGAEGGAGAGGKEEVEKRVKALTKKIRQASPASSVLHPKGVCWARRRARGRPRTSAKKLLLEKSSTSTSAQRSVPYRLPSAAASELRMSAGEQVDNVPAMKNEMQQLQAKLAAM
jgi:hypothetical protein